MRHEKTVSVSKIRPLWEPWEEDQTPRKSILVVPGLICTPPASAIPADPVSVHMKFPLVKLCYIKLFRRKSKITTYAYDQIVSRANMQYQIQCLFLKEDK